MLDRNYRSGRARSVPESVVKLEFVRDPRPMAQGYAGMMGEVRIFTISYTAGKGWISTCGLPGVPKGRETEYHANAEKAMERSVKTLRNWLTKADIDLPVETNR